MLIVIVIFPIIPVLIASLLVLIIMSFAKFTKNRDRFQLIATILILAIVFISSFAISNTNTSQEEMINMVVKANGLVEIIKGTFPTLGMALESLSNGNLINQILNLLALIIVTGAIYIIYILIGQRLYLKGAVGNLSSGKKTNKKLNEQKAFRNSSLAKTYIGKEIKTLIRNPIFFMQCVLPAILFPILIVVMTFTGIKEEQGGNITDISNMIQNKSTIFLGISILCAIQFFLMFVYTSATAISREGQNAIFMKYIPVSFMKQIDYKVIPNIIMTSFMTILTITLIQYLINIPLLYLIIITFAGIMMGILQSYLCIIIDLKKPKLEWNSEYAVVKQNMNLIWPVIFGIINITILVILSIFLQTYINSYILILLIAIVYLFMTVVTRNYIKNNINRLMKKIY